MSDSFIFCHIIAINKHGYIMNVLVVYVMNRVILNEARRGHAFQARVYKTYTGVSDDYYGDEVILTYLDYFFYIN